MRHASGTGWPAVSGAWTEAPGQANGQGWPGRSPGPGQGPPPAGPARAGLAVVLEAVVVGPSDTLGLRIAPGSPAEMDEAAARIFADVKRWRPELEGRVLVVAAEQVFAVRGEPERP